VPAIRSAATRVASQHPRLSHDDLVALVGALWAAPVHERRMAAVELLASYHDRLHGEDMVLLERLLRQSRTWALVDPLAASVVGRLAERCPQLGMVLDRWRATRTSGSAGPRCSRSFLRCAAVTAISSASPGTRTRCLTTRSSSSGRRSAGCCATPPGNGQTWSTR